MYGSLRLQLLYIWFVWDQLQLSDSKTHLNKFERNNVDLPFMPLTENLYKIRITHDNACKINFKQFKALFLISDRGGRFLFRFIFEVFLIYFIWYVLTVSANFWYDSSIEPFFSLFLVSRSNFGMFRFFFQIKFGVFRLSRQNFGMIWLYRPKFGMRWLSRQNFNIFSFLDQNLVCFDFLVPKSLQIYFLEPASTSFDFLTKNGFVSAV